MKNISLLFLLTYIVIDLTAKPIPDEIIFKNSILVIDTRCSWFNVQIPIQIVIKNNFIYIEPKQNKQYFRNIAIQINNIIGVGYDSLKYIYIYLSDGCSYKISIYKKQELLKCFDNYNVPKNLITITKKDSINNTSNNKLRISTWGSPIFSKLNVNVNIKVMNNILYIDPIEYKCYFKNIEIQISDIEKINKKLFGILKIKLHSGVVYKIKSSEINKLINLIQ